MGYSPKEVLTNPQSEVLKEELKKWNVEIIDENHAVLKLKK